MWIYDDPRSGCPKSLCFEEIVEKMRSVHHTVTEVLGIRSFVQGGKAVSYTHLDVYKRQGHHVTIKNSRNILN